jgi:hypothetical protein
VVVSCATEFVLSRYSTETFRVDIVNELVAEFQKQEEWRSLLESLKARVYDLIF